MRKQQIQTQKQVSAYSRQITHRLLYDVVEFLEKYIEFAGYYSDWEQRKQIKDNKVVRPISSPEDAEECFSIVLLGFVGTMKSKPDFIREEIKNSFYEWIDATGIDVNNCHPRLKHCLFGISEVIEGKGKKIITDMINSKETLKPGTPEYARELGNIFTKMQGPLNNEREIELSLEGKTYKDIEIERQFKGSSDRGQKTFERITKDHNYQDFHFFPQETQQSHPTSSAEVVQEVKNNFQNWKVDEIATEIDSYSGLAKKQEIAVYCHHARLDAHDRYGKLDFNNNPIYLWENFNSQQRFEIKRVKNISGGYLTNDEIKWIVKEVKENPKVWRVEPIRGHECLIHNSAQGNDDEIGTLIHDKRKFNIQEQAEINEALKIVSVRQEIVNEVIQNIDKWKIENKVVSHSWYGGRWHKNQPEPVLIREDAGEIEYNSSNGDIITKPGKIYVVNKDLNQAERDELGIKSDKMERGINTSISQDDNKGNNGVGKIFGIVGIIAVLVIGGVVVVRKRLFKKVKK